MTPIAYIFVGVLVASVCAIGIRNGFARDYPTQDVDKPVDWAAYTFCGAMAGLVWPLAIALACLAWLLRSASRRWWS
jgi:hypothetical protein